MKLRGASCLCTASVMCEKANVNFLTVLFGLSKRKDKNVSQFPKKWGLAIGVWLTMASSQSAKWCLAYSDDVGFTVITKKNWWHEIEKWKGT